MPTRKRIELFQSRAPALDPFVGCPQVRVRGRRYRVLISPQGAWETHERNTQILGLPIACDVDDDAKFVDAGETRENRDECPADSEPFEWRRRSLARG